MKPASSECGQIPDPLSTGSKPGEDVAAVERIDNSVAIGIGCVAIQIARADRAAETG